jgi:myo-inositol catabolism protein IolC
MSQDVDRIYLLAFDHRGSFQKKLLGIGGEPTPDEVARIRNAKRIIFDGFRKALESGLSLEGAGIHIDEQFGAEIAREALALGAQLATPVEKSGQDELDFESGDQFGRHIVAFEPTYAKVLVRYNPEGDPELNRRHAIRLACLGDWLHETRHEFLFELLVPAEPHQLEQVGGDADRYDRELRPNLVIEVIRECQQAGVEPDIWKFEWLGAREDCVRIADAARADGRDHVRCVVLGRGGDERKVVGWLRAGAGVPGFVGVAVGRTIWWDPLEAWLAGTSPDDAASRIAENYTRLVDAYQQAETVAA